MRDGYRLQGNGSASRGYAKRIHPRWITKEKSIQRVPSIKEVENLLRDPNGIAVRPSGFDCVRLCHPERSGAKSNCEAAPSKARWDLGRTPLKMTRRGNTCQKSKGARAFVRTPFHTPCPARYSVLHLLDVLSGGNKPSLCKGRWIAKANPSLMDHQRKKHPKGHLP